MTEMCHPLYLTKWINTTSSTSAKLLLKRKHVTFLNRWENYDIFFFSFFFSFLFFLVALLEYLVHFHLTLTDVSWWLKVNLHPSLKQRWDYSIQACSVTCIRMCCFSVAGFALKPGLVWLSETFQKKVMAVDEARMTSFFFFFCPFFCLLLDFSLLTFLHCSEYLAVFLLKHTIEAQDLTSANVFAETADFSLLSDSVSMAVNTFLYIFYCTM